jgi:hypothetical protein
MTPPADAAARAQELAARVIEANGPLDRSDEGLLARGVLALMAELERVTRERDQWHGMYEVRVERSDKSLAAARERETQLREALTAIDRYSCYGTPWHAYMDVKRIARAALAGPPAPAAEGRPS